MLHSKLITAFFILMTLLSCKTMLKVKQALSGGNDVIEGKFLDSAVEGLTFSFSGSKEGITDSEGSFHCLETEKISFKIGNIEIGSTTCATIITPVELVTQNRYSNFNNLTTAEQNKVINLSILLQSLDSDGNLANGITIRADMAVELEKKFTLKHIGSELHLNYEGNEFGDNSYEISIQEVINESFSSDTSLNVVSAVSAKNHLESTLSSITPNSDCVINGCDITPPTITSSSPEYGQLFQAESTTITLSVITDEVASCKYDLTTGTPYLNMSHNFSSTESTSHYQDISITVAENSTDNYSYHVKCTDEHGNAMIADHTISFSVENIANIVDTTPPTISNLLPAGQITRSTGTITETLRVTTSENATCRYHLENISYDSMNNFSNTGTLSHQHSINITVASDSTTSHTYYVRCMDQSDNVTTANYNISFTVVARSNNNPSSLTIGHSHTDIRKIPLEWIIEAKNTLKIAYNHTSHGSQIISGMNALEQFPDFNNLYSWGSSTTNGQLELHDSGISGAPADLGGDTMITDTENAGNTITQWAQGTRSFLDSSAGSDINVIVWSWCNIAGHDITNYNHSMTTLISEYGPGGSKIISGDRSTPVYFIYMTGHANGGGENDTSDSRNEQIRTHVNTTGGILFDFSDIENYDPYNNYYLDLNVEDGLHYNNKNDNWATDYLSGYLNSSIDQSQELTDNYLLVNGTGTYGGIDRCSHSPESGESSDSTLNCALKGKAFWWLLARLAGWDGPS